MIVKPIIESLEMLDIDDDTYFKEYSSYISNSRLSLINPEQDGSPDKYLNNVHSYSSSLTLGSAVHQMILQCDEFYIVDNIDRPTAKMGNMADYLYPLYLKGGISNEDVIAASDAVNYYKGKMDDDKILNVYEKCTKYWEDRKLNEEQLLPISPIYLDPKSRNTAKSCINSILHNRGIIELLRPMDCESYNEATFLIDFDVNGKILKFKAKLDNFTINRDLGIITLNDLKTTGHYVDKFSESFNKYHYYRQMSIYAMLLKLWCDKNNIAINGFTSNMLLVSTVNSDTGIYKVGKSQIIRGLKEFNKLMLMVSKYY